MFDMTHLNVLSWFGYDCLAIPGSPCNASLHRTRRTLLLLWLLHACCTAWTRRPGIRLQACSDGSEPVTVGVFVRLNHVSRSLRILEHAQSLLFLSGDACSIALPAYDNISLLAATSTCLAL